MTKEEFHNVNTKEVSNEMKKFEVWFERKEYSKVFQKSQVVVPKDRFFLGYYNTLDEIIKCFNEEDCVFENSIISSVIYATDSFMKAVTRLMRTHASTFYPFKITPKDLNSIKIIDLFNKEKINSIKEIFVLSNYGIEEFKEVCQTQEFDNWKLSVNRSGMLIWVPSNSEKNSIGTVVSMTIAPYYVGLTQPPFNITRKIGTCTESIFSFKELQEIIFGKENKAPIITNKILLDKKRIIKLLLQEGFEFDEIPSRMCDYAINFKLFFKGSSRKILATITADVNIEAWNVKIHKQIDNGKIKKLILSNGVLEFIDLTEKDKEDLHKYYEWHGKEG